MDVGVVGGSGYGGGELLRLLAGHPTLKIRTIAGASSAGRSVTQVLPQLRGLDLPETLAPSEPEALAGCDVVFLATPHEASLALAPPLLEAGAVVIDLSAAFRLPPGPFADWYGQAHTAPDLAPATYGLPELWRANLAGAQLVAAPGCYPTAALLALAPLAGLVEPEGIVIAGLSGTSGAGRSVRDDLQASHAFGNAAAYGVPRHRHTPEIEAGWQALAGVSAPVTFTPHLLPTARGLLCTVSARVAVNEAAATSAGEIRSRYGDAYDAEPFVHLLPEGTWPALAHVVGGNAAHVAVALDERTGRVTASCAIDNLGKGAAGQALQAANVALGLPEGAGLSPAGVYP
jgi:N-acetyl-gamma-glutamyl-phosphate reductase